MKYFNSRDARPKGEWASYDTVVSVTMLQQDEAFLCVQKEGRPLQGQPGDFLVHGADGVYYPVSAEDCEANYEFRGAIASTAPAQPEEVTPDTPPPEQPEQPGDPAAPATPEVPGAA